MSVKSPCKADCKDRCVGCRATCAAYMVYSVGKGIEMRERDRMMKPFYDATGYFTAKNTRLKRRELQRKKWRLLNKYR